MTDSSAAEQFGRFDDTAREFVITDPRTPYPWINYLGSQEFFSLISNTAGGYSFYRDAKFRRLTRYRYNNVPTDVGGRYFFIRDALDVWTPGWMPVKAELDRFECRQRDQCARSAEEVTAIQVGLHCFELWQLVRKTSYFTK